MTDKKPEISQAAPGTSASPGPTTTSQPKAVPPTKTSRTVLLPAFIIVLLLAAALAAGLWYQQEQFKQTSSGLITQMSTGISTSNQAAEQAQQALSLLQEQSRKIAALESALGDSRNQIDSLELAFRNLTDSGSDLVLLNDIDHLLTIAQQQLQLSGNVANAVISLETAQAQLARANRPGLASLLQTINGDLDHLRAVSTIDIAALSTELDELSALISEAPLLVPDDVAPAIVQSEPVSSAVVVASPENGIDSSAPWWQQALDTADDWSRSAWSSIRQDLGQFITVRRVDDPAALLISPDQAARFRENLRLRIMTAQLALMMRQPKVWQAETNAVVHAVERRYDQKSQQARQALKLARQMADTSIDIKLPTVTNSLQAVEALREASAKSARDSAADATDPSVSDEPQAEPDAAPNVAPDAASVTPQG